MKHWSVLLMVLLQLIGVRAEAQTKAAPSLADYQAAMNRATSATKDSNIANNLPGYQGDAPDLQSRSGESVSQLQSEGQGASATNPVAPAISATLNYKSTNVIDPSALWVQNAFQTEANAGNNTSAAGVGGTAGTSCNATVNTVTTHDLYTCDSGKKVEDGTQTCRLVYTPTIENSYIYDCKLTWVDGQAGLVADPTCQALAATGSCSLSSSSCTQGATNETQGYSCFVGTSHTENDQTCNVFHNYSTSTAFQYQCDRSEFFDKFAAVPGVDTMIYIDECAFGYNHKGQVQTDYGCGYIQANYASHCADGEAFNGGPNHIYMCDLAITGVSGVAYQGTINNGCQSYRTNSGCHQIAANCTGMMYDVWCRSDIRTFQCDSQVGGTAPSQTLTTYTDLGTDTSGCQALQSNPACSAASSACTQLMDSGITAALGLPARTCQTQTVGYACDQTGIVNYCTGNAPTGDGWTDTTTDVCHQSGADVCGIKETQYAWTKTDGVGGCKEQTNEYSCSGDVPAGDPAKVVQAFQNGGNWLYSPSCAPKTDPGCEQPPTTACTEGASTKIVDGVSVTASCWQQTETYSCEQADGPKSDCAPAAGCTLQKQSCLDPTVTDLASCQTVESVYDCATTTTAPTGGQTCTVSYSNGAQTTTTSDSDENDLPAAAAALNAVKQAGADYQTNPDLKIFDGTNYQCKKAIFGLYNCCRDSGILLGYLVSCSADEKTLYQEQETKSCHYVGTYCSSKALFGSCLEKKMSYCCYGSVLARIIEEAGHQQLSKSWGDAQGPSCGGFSIDEFTQLDLTNVDFSDFYAQKLGTLNADGSSTVADITASLRNMTAAKSPAK